MTNVAGRLVNRIMLHNGVHLGRPPNARVEKSIFSQSYPGDTPQGRPLADLMTVTPAGILVVFEGEVEKLIPWANVYECDLETEAKDGQVKEAPKKTAVIGTGRVVAPAEAAVADVRPVANVRPTQGPARPARRTIVKGD